MGPFLTTELTKLIVVVLIGFLFYFNLFFNPFLGYKKYRTLEEVLKVTKYLLVIVHSFVIGLVGIMLVAFR